MSEAKSSSTNKELIIGILAAVAAIGAHLKAPDTTAAETGHKLHAVEIVALEANVNRLQRDLSNLHAFMIGYVNEQHAHEIDDHAKEEVAAARPRSRRSRAVTPVQRVMRKAPKLPSLSAAPKKKAKQHRSLSDALGISDEELAAELQMISEEAEAMEAEAPPEFIYEAMPEEMPDNPF